jgi:hypothetical protein
MAVKGDQEISFKAEDHTIPEFLFKYCKLDAKNRKWIQRIFTHNEICFASPKEFNDPFDCRVQASFDATDEEVQSYLISEFEKLHPEWDSNKREDEARLRMKWLKEPGAQREIVNNVQDMVYKVGVFCLSEKKDDILMWSHYADGHKGFCLQFQIKPEFYPFGELLFKVDYRSLYPQVVFAKNTEAQTRAVLMTKADFWIYEKEWRIFDPDNGPGIRAYPDEMLTGVIFGCEMPYEDRQLIRGWAKGRKVPLKLYQTTKKEKEFGLEIIKTIG